MSYSCVRTYGTNVMKDYPIYYDMWVVGEACPNCHTLAPLFGFAVNLVSYGKFHSLSTCTRLCVCVWDTFSPGLQFGSLSRAALTKVCIPDPPVCV